MSTLTAMHEPDARIEVGAHHCSLWWSRTPRWAGDRTGFIGHWPDHAEEAGPALLSAATMQLRRAGCAIAVGPIDGSTWHRYRFVVEDGGDAPFPFEPTLRDDGTFAAAGFDTIATYRSIAVATRAVRVAAPEGIRIRSFPRDDAESELGAFHAISIEAFRDAFLYAALEREAFFAMYRPVLPAVDPDLVLVAEQAGQPVGFVFALPDPSHGRVVIKTVAVRDSVRGRGVGAALMQTLEARAHDRGYRQAIHALAHDGNRSLGFSADRGRVLRRYALLGCALKPESAG